MRSQRERHDSLRSFLVSRFLLLVPSLTVLCRVKTAKGLSVHRWCVWQRAENFDDESDMVDAFVACGGRPDKQGHVKRETLVKVRTGVYLTCVPDVPGGRTHASA
jgi:hypothetical protein